MVKEDNYRQALEAQLKALQDVIAMLQAACDDVEQMLDAEPEA